MMMMMTPDSHPTLPNRVGFLGLGRMGRAMAKQFLDAGVEVVVWNRSPEPMSALVESGAIAGASPADVFETGHVFSMLANESVVREVFSSDALASAPEGLVHVNHATISARAADELAALHHEHRHAYVAAPVIGRPEVADRGQLTILAAGDSNALNRSMPALEVVGKRVWQFGNEPASANIAKIAVNFLIIHALQGLAESLTLLEHYGLDTEVFIEAIGDSIFPGPVYAGYGRSIASQLYSPAGFTTTLGQKDLNLALSAAEDAGVVLPSASTLRAMFENRIDQGQGDLDWASIAEVTRDGSHRPSDAAAKGGTPE